MNLSKKLVKSHFSKSSSSYDDNSCVQALMAKLLLEKLKDKDFDKILEIGCGTGRLSKLILDKCNFSKLLVNDLSKQMLLSCKENLKENTNFSKVCFYEQDAEKLELSDCFNLIISNACFQWFENLNTVLLKLKENLKQDGTLCFSTFLKGNFKEIYQLTGLSLNYLDKEQLESIVKANFKHCTIEYYQKVEHFDTVKALLQSLKNAGVSGLSQRVWTKGQLQSFMQEYQRDYQDKEGIPLTYQFALVYLKD